MCLVHLSWNTNIVLILFRFPFSLDYIVLEDLTRPFSFPCIIDLKLGIRCHGDLGNPEKHLRRSKETTSLSLGVRFIGMLVSGYYQLYRDYSCKTTAIVLVAIPK